jgi:hypothetical protein
LQATVSVTVAPAGDALPTHLQRLGDVKQGVTGLQLQQCAGSLHGAGSATAAGRDRNQMGLVGGTQSEWFF